MSARQAAGLGLDLCRSPAAPRSSSTGVRSLRGNAPQAKLFASADYRTITRGLRRMSRGLVLLRDGLASHRIELLRGFSALAVVLRVLLAWYCPTPFGYVNDYYHEAIELFWQKGHLPIASDCWQCYHPPFFYVLGLPFYAAGRSITASLDSSADWGLRSLTLLPLAAAVTATYSANWSIASCRTARCQSSGLRSSLRFPVSSSARTARRPTSSSRRS